MAEGGEKRPRTVDDYDTGNLTADYEPRNVIIMTGSDAPTKIVVGPTPVTKTQTKFVEERLAHPVMMQLELPDMTERRLWKPDEAARWYAAYARNLYDTVVKPKEGPAASAVYVHFKNGGEEEVIVAALLWVLVEPQAVPKTIDAWKAWRESNAYLWVWDERLEDTLAVVQLAATQLMPAEDIKASASASVMINWLKRSKSSGDGDKKEVQ